MTQTQLLGKTTSSEKASGRPGYSLLLTDDADDIVAAGRLRREVFAGEFGAMLGDGHADIDYDSFDPLCDHLIVRDNGNGDVVGTYRMLPPDRARQVGGLYADREFDLSCLDRLRPELVEVGRSCVRQGHRNGAVVGLMWAGIARYMVLSGRRYLAGCASVPVRDGGSLAAGVHDVVTRRHYAPDAYRVHPYRRWSPVGVSRPSRAVLPPLLRAYLRLGAQVCGQPALDPAFGVADFFVLLAMDSVDERYLDFFLGRAHGNG